MRSTLFLPLLTLALAGCGSSEPEGPQAVTLRENYAPPGGGFVWTCDDGTALTLTSEETARSTICLGVDGSRCPGEFPGPGSAECDDPAHNKFKGTCVETFFSCFQPTGTCMVGGNGNQTWSSGAVQDRNSGGFLASYMPDGNTACVTAVNNDATTSVIYTQR